MLLGFVLGVNKAWLYAHPTRPLSESEIERYEELVRRRMCHEPVAYLVGFKPFYGLDITVDPPRADPPARDRAVGGAGPGLSREPGGPGRRPSVADMGTGNGAIAVALAVNVPESVVYAVDVSDEALAVAAQNVWRYGLGEQVQLLPGYLLEPLPAPVDVIVANLPYMATGDLSDLPPQVREYEPALALDGGRTVYGSSPTCWSPWLRRRAAENSSGRARLSGDRRGPRGCGAGACSGFLPEAEVRVVHDYADLDRMLILALPEAKQPESVLQYYNRT